MTQPLDPVPPYSSYSPWIDPTTRDSPLGSQIVINGGHHVPRRALDRWNVAPAGLQHIVIAGDSVPQATGTGTLNTLYLDGFINRLQRGLGNALGGLRGAGYIGLHRSLNALGFANTASEWTAAGAFTRVIEGNGSVMPYRSEVIAATAADILTFTPIATVAPRGVLDAVTNGTTTITSATAAFVATDKGQGVYGTGIPKYSMITAVNSGTSITINRATTTSQAGGLLSLSGRNLYPGGIAGLEIVWVDGPFNGAFSYSTDNGATWIAVPSTTPAAATIKRTFVATALPSGNFKIRAADAGGVGHFTAQCGIILYNVGVLPTSGCLVHNVACDGATLDAISAGGLGKSFLDPIDDNLRFLDPGPNLANQSLKPVLLVVYFTNDMLFANAGQLTVAQIQADVNTVIDRFEGYCDIIFMNDYEQGGGVDPVIQAAVRAGVRNTCTSRGVAVLDVYDAWAAQGDVGFAQSTANGLMLDNNHPSLKGQLDIGAHIMRILSTSAL